MAEQIDWKSLDDAQFVEKAEHQIWLSAFAANNPRAPAHRESDHAYDEAKRREKPWLYQRAWNKAYRSAGYVPSASDIARALPHSEPEATHG
jgi:hypothetical protein